MSRLQSQSVLERQWAGYPATHRTRANLWIHMVAVPTFIGSTVALVVALTHLAWGATALAIVLAAASVWIQGLGHRLERVAAEPFTGPVNAACRLALEQWITFPRFVLGGRWLAALRQSRQS